MVKKWWLFCVSLSHLARWLFSSQSAASNLGAFSFHILAALIQVQIWVFIVARGAFCGSLCLGRSVGYLSRLFLLASRTDKHIILPWNGWSWTSQGRKVLPGMMHVLHLWPLQTWNGSCFLWPIQMYILVFSPRSQEPFSLMMMGVSAHMFLLHLILGILCKWEGSDLLQPFLCLANVAEFS